MKNWKRNDNGVFINMQKEDKMNKNYETVEGKETTV